MRALAEQGGNRQCEVFSGTRIAGFAVSGMVFMVSQTRRSALLCRSTLIALMLLAGTSGATATPTNAPPNPPVPMAQSPVRIFRELLVKSSAEREEYFSLHPTALREPLEMKIKEYLALTPDDRELRLQATELRFYLLQLMAIPPTNRPTILAQISEPMRSAVSARLELWNLLPPPMQAEVLENEQAVRYFTQLGVASEAQRKSLLDPLPADRRAKLEADIARFRALPEATRIRVFGQFNQFFDLSRAERDNALRHLSDPERKAMEQTLASFDQLTPEQRRNCIRSFEKFAGMSLVERQQFLKNAEAWQRMTPTERERWRALVARVPRFPPLPPGFFPSPPLPPLPQSRPAAALLLTNGN